MAKEDDYDILPHKQIEELQKEAERLKELPFGKGKTGKDLAASIDTLNTSINKLIEVFENATEALKRDEGIRHETTVVTASAPSQTVYDKMEALIDQNRIIAQALLNVANMVKDIKKEDKTKEKVEAVAEKMDIKEPTRLELKSSKQRFEPKFEELKPRNQFVPPMQSPEPLMPPVPRPPQQQPQFAQQPMDSFFATGGPIPMHMQGPANPPMPDNIPPLPDLPTIDEYGYAKEKKPLFGFK